MRTKNIKTCLKCGECCTSKIFGWVDIEPSDIKKWKKHALWPKIRPHLDTTSYNNTGFLIDFDLHNDKCVFLDGDNKCSFHKKWCRKFKPLNCRKFLCSANENKGLGFRGSRTDLATLLQRSFAREEQKSR